MESSDSPLPRRMPTALHTAARMYTWKRSHQLSTEHTRLTMHSCTSACIEAIAAAATPCALPLQS